MYHSPGQSGRKQTERIAERVHTRSGLQQSYNLAERMLRAQVVGRRNWTFLGSNQGGWTATVLYSLTGTCKHHHIDPFAYLQDVLRRLPAHPAGGCLMLILACVIYWQAKEISWIVWCREPEDEAIDVEMLEHVSPIEWDNVILYGEYVLDRNRVC